MYVCVFAVHIFLSSGCGASVIFGLLGVRSYHWSMLCIDIDPYSIKHAENLINHNQLHSKLKVRWNDHPEHIFQNVIRPEER